MPPIVASSSHSIFKKWKLLAQSSMKQSGRGAHTQCILHVLCCCCCRTKPAGVRFHCRERLLSSSRSFSNQLQVWNASGHNVRDIACLERQRVCKNTANCYGLKACQSIMALLLFSLTSDTSLLDRKFLPQMSSYNNTLNVVVGWLALFRI
jgi:hypothetical protein